MCMFRVMTGLFVSLSLALVAASAPAADTYNLPAHWTDDPRDPGRRMGDRPFYGISFSSPTEGWVTGPSRTLHVQGDRLTLLRFGRKLNFSTITRTDDGGVWIGGSRLNWRGRRRGYEVSPVAWSTGPSGQRWLDWQPGQDAEPEADITQIAVRGSREVWAIVLKGPVGHKIWTELYRNTGEKWQPDPIGRPPGMMRSLLGLCFDGHGRGWAVGSEKTGSGGRRGIVLRHDGERWRQETLAVTVGPDWSLREVECLPDGSAIAGGWKGPWDAARATEIVLLRYDGAWRRVALPAWMKDGRELNAMAAVSRDEAWFATSNRERGDRMVHLKGEVWQQVPLPEPPDKRNDDGGVNVTGLAFPAADAGWAIANDYGGPSLVRGLLLRYDGKKWRYQGWNWHWWDEPRFGLF